MALWTRSGVAARPSRVGSSPRRTSISWTRSSKVALVRVVGSFVCSIGAGFISPWVDRPLCPITHFRNAGGKLHRSLRPRLRAGPSARRARLRMTRPLGLAPWFIGARVLEGVHHGFFESYSFKMRLLEAALQYFVDLDREVFRGGYEFGEFLQGIQVLQVIAGEHFPFNKTVEIDEVADHAGAGVDRAADGDFEGVVVAVAVRVVALAVGGDVFLGGHLRAVQAVRRREVVAAGEM